MSVPTTMETARQLVLTLLRGTDTPTRQEIRHNTDLVASMLRGDRGVTFDEEALVRDVEAACNVWIDTATTLEDPRGHEVWLPERRAHIEWRFWRRYRRYLEEVDEMAPQAVRRLDEITDQTLGLLENPGRPGGWDRRGMVVGQVQSGKTANYTGLICKAADAGYRLIIVLAGSHNNLRSQTQMRLDKGVLGFDTKRGRDYDPGNARIGVGDLPGVELYRVHTVTQATERGDFNLRVARQAIIMFGGAEPVLLVVKKNQSILKNLIRWATFIQQQRDPQSGRSQVRGVPLLVIDDEADNASINTKAIPLDERGLPLDDYDPTKINGLIRRLLHSFEQSAYLGYTATPFANIFIPQGVDSVEHGEDLFPRSFIINLPVPSNYLGPARVFGLQADVAAALEHEAGLPIIRPIDDQGGWVPDDHRYGHIPGPLPPSLKQAIRSFLLVCAVRTLRGQESKHSSMLIHVTRFTSVQKRVVEQVKDELAVLQRRLDIGDGKAPGQLLDELRELWETDFRPTTAAFPDAFKDITAKALTWAELADALPDAAGRIQVLEINGTARDVLAYDEHEKDGLHCIAVGGDKLSRGLTLEGLSVSYYLRASRMYDTLMQMGRWFGYRPGYADLCRLYTTTELTGWYRDITAASEELRGEFDQMAAMGETPEEYGLRVKSHPDGLMITAAAKMRHGTSVWVSFSAAISETVVFDTRRAISERNLRVTGQLLHSLGAPLPPQERPREDSFGGPLWRTGNAEDIVAFLETFETHPTARKARGAVLAKYINGRIAAGELGEWMVGLASGNGDSATVGEQNISLVRRTALAADTMLTDRYRIRRLVSPRDEASDLDVEEMARALAHTRETWAANRGRSRRTMPPDNPSGQAIRRVRSARRGLLLLYPLDPTEVDPGGLPIIGFAVSFPESTGASAVEYVVNNTYWQQEFGDQ